MAHDESSFWKRVESWLPKLFADEEFDAVRIEPEVIEDICTLARGSHPKEMVAFLTGDIRKEQGKRLLVIDGLYLKGYDASEDATSFTTHDLPMTGVRGTVHSHPGWFNTPSAADRRLFDKHGWFHLIVCQPYTSSSIAAYNKQGERIEVAVGEP
jgi:proteasome lid subunit RPN8/RPN11